MSLRMPWEVFWDGTPAAVVDALLTEATRQHHLALRELNGPGWGTAKAVREARAAYMRKDVAIWERCTGKTFGKPRQGGSDRG